MTAEDLCQALKLSVLAGKDGMGSQVTGCYIGDLLSWVMGRAQGGDVWITVMGNVNAIAVAKLADVCCIVLCDNAPLDGEAREQADQKGIPVLQSEQNAYTLAIRLHQLLNQAESIFS